MKEEKEDTGRRASDVTIAVGGEASDQGEGPRLVAGRYRCLRKLGSGAFGNVYLAQDELLERMVCLKLLRPETDFTHDSAELAQRFLREAQAAAKLKHPNIVTIHDAVEHEGQLVIVMEYIDGETLRDKLNREGRLDVSEALGIATQIAAGLDFAHDRGIIHRDIKPANILIGKDRVVKVGDFGTALMHDKPKLTGTAGLVGTPAYMAPEQIQGREVDRRSDVFSLGCLLYEMLAGVRPFADANIAAVLFKIVNDQPSEFADLGIAIPTEVQRTVFHALEKDPEQRFPRASDLIKDILGTLPEILPRSVSRLRVGKWWWVIGSAVVVLGLLLAATLLPLSRPSGRISISVMPFENQTQQSESTFITDGFSAEINRLLLDHSSIMLVPANDLRDQVRNGLSLPQAGRKAGASFVLAGKLTSKGRSFMLEYSLLDTTKESLRSDSVPVGLTNLQGSITQINAQTLAWLGLGAAPKGETANPQAYELYLKGISKITAMEVGDRQAFEEGRALLERAAAVESSAEIYGGLARLFYEAVNQGVSCDRANLDLSLLYLDKGIALKPDYLPFATLKVRTLLQEGKAEESLKTATDQLMANRLAPQLVSAVGWCLRHNGDYQLSEQFYRYGLRLLPKNYLIKLNLGRCLFFAGKHSQALEMMQECAIENPQRLWPAFDLAHHYAVLGDAVRAKQWMPNLLSTPPMGLIRYQVARVSGETLPFTPTAEQLEAAEVDFDISYWVTECYSLDGNTEKARIYLNKTLVNGWTAWDYFDQDPLLANLRKTTEYQTLRATGIVDQAARRTRERAIIQPLLAKLAIKVED